MQMPEILKKIFEDGVIKAVTALCKCVQSVFQYLENRRADKKEEARHEAVEKAEDRLDKACDKGTLDDLIEACIEYGKEVKK